MSLMDAWNGLMSALGYVPQAELISVQTNLTSEVALANQNIAACAIALNELAPLQKSVTILTGQLEATITALSTCHALTDSDNAALAALQTTVSGLTTQLTLQNNAPVSCPSWLDQTQNAYTPPIRKCDMLNDCVDIAPQDIYSQSGYLWNTFMKYLSTFSVPDLTPTDINFVSQLSSLPVYLQLIAAWRFVIDLGIYDTGETSNITTYAWYWHGTTLAIKVFECDEGTVVFIDLCRMLGITADRVFNCIGQCTFGYHSFPVVFLYQADIDAAVKMGLTGAQFVQPGAQIYETTDHGFHPVNPMQLQGSDTYFIDNMANWQFQGVPTQPFLGTGLNGVIPSAAKANMPAARFSAHNGKRHPNFRREKIEAIKKIWRARPGHFRPGYKERIL